MSVHVGDRVRIESERAGQSGRAGLVEEVLSEQPQRLRVRREDERTSIFAPATGVAHSEPAASGAPAEAADRQGEFGEMIWRNGVNSTYGQPHRKDPQVVANREEALTAPLQS